MIIAICASMAFSEEQMRVKAELEKLGHTAFVSGFIDNYLGKTPEETQRLTLRDKLERDAIREHFETIKKSDAILVLNYDRKGIKNYIGGNTFLEIGLAYCLRKKVFLLNPVPEMMYTEEINGMKPVVVGGDLKKIK